MSIAFINAHRRIAFATAVKKEAQRLDLGKVYCFDQDILDPIAHILDGAHLIPSLQSLGAIQKIMSLCKSLDISLIIPWLDPDILECSRNIGFLHSANVKLLAPPVAYVELFTDKLATALWVSKFKCNPIPFQDRTQIRFPAVIKPRFGQGAVGVKMVRTQVQAYAALEELEIQGKEALVQEYIDGIEYTIDCGTTLEGIAHFCVARKRLKTRGGEVLISQIDQNPRVLEFARQVIAYIPANAIINIQCFVTKSGEVFLSEINPRFSGGIDLTIKAGVDVPRYALELGYHGEFVTPPPRNVQDGLLMTRFHEAIFVGATS